MKLQILSIIIMASISAYVGIRNLSLYFVKRQYDVNLHFSLICFAIVAYDACEFFIDITGNPAFMLIMQRLQILAGILMALTIVPFVFRLLEKRIGLIAMIFIILSGLSFIMTAVLPEGVIFNLRESFVNTVSFFGYKVTYFEAELSPIMWMVDLFFVFGIVYAFYLLIRSIGKDNKKEIIPILAGFSIFLISCLLDCLVELGVFDFIYTMEYSFLSLVILMDYSLMRHLSVLYREQETSREKLEIQVEERTAEIKRLAEKLAKQNERLEELVEKDSLTELYNHAAFFKRLHAFLNASRRHFFPLSLLIIDIDNFKNFNDKYGHLFGDTVIKSISVVLRNASREYDEKARNTEEEVRRKADSQGLRDYDIISRYGGDEFTVLLLYCGEAESAIVIRRLMDKIESLRFPEFPHVVVTCSMGVVYLDSQTACPNSEELFKVADRALYEAKRKGKNQCVISSYK